MSTPPLPTGPGYGFASADAEHTHAYLWPTVFAELDRLGLSGDGKRVFDLGCGNGATAKALADRGWRVSGVDPSESGIGFARSAYPDLDLRCGSSDDDLPAVFGTFPAVVSLEVVEHVFLPRQFAARVRDLLEPGGTAVLSTPYHGYWKNLALAVTGKMDAHFTALWDYGHIKFWSPGTLSALLRGAGLDVVRVVRVGRIPVLARSMVVVARRPA
jgi:2-polyprenyl-3-methyl-5-hydroxy-6-metoxy-1,4-benzoquinol methylase